MIKILLILTISRQGWKLFGPWVCLLLIKHVDKAVFIGMPRPGTDIFAKNYFPLLFLRVASTSSSHKLIKLYLKNNARAGKGGLLLPTKPPGAITEHEVKTHNTQLIRDVLTR